jgi:arylsulfatase A
MTLPTFAVLLVGSMMAAPTASEALPEAQSGGGGRAVRPNILLLLSDDQGWSGLEVPMHPSLPGAHDPRVRTPEIVQLASSGMRFSQAYSPAPVCSPTRASLQTGLNPAALGWTKAARSLGPENNPRLLPPESERDLDPGYRTLAEVLSDAGYTTAHFGKWHLGGGGPGAHGYEVHDGDTSNADAAPFTDPNPVDIFGMVERTERFMERALEQERPFFAQLSFHALHYPQNARAATIERVRSRGGWRNEQELLRAAIAEDLDDGVGRLMAALERLDLERSTWVIYTSDNGQGGGGRDDALSGGKGGVDEGGIRVPFIVRGPGVERGSWCHRPIVGYDLFPTFVELAGADALDRLHGVSLSALFEDPSAELDRGQWPLVFHFPHYQGRSKPQSALRVGDRKLVWSHEDNGVALYDLEQDPGETRDLASREPERAAELEGELRRVLEVMQARFPRPNPDHDPTRAGAGEEASGGGRRESRDAGGGGAGGRRRGRGEDGGEDGGDREASDARGRDEGVRASADEAQVPEQARPFLHFPELEVSWDDEFVYVESDGLPDHPMMVGIRTWNQQVPLPQRFRGMNAFRIPRHPVRLDRPRATTLIGPIALAANGVPIFDPTTQGGIHDAFENGELDQYGGHAGRADDYHYHLAPLHLLDVVDRGVPIAVALDGFGILGLTEPDGSSPGPLDEAHGHGPGEEFHYHASLEKPYFMSGFAGEVDLDIRPTTSGWRPPTRPLRGARITDFRGDRDSGFQLTYVLDGAEHRVDYSVRSDGGVDFEFREAGGAPRVESYPAPGAARDPSRRDRERRGPARGAARSDGDASLDPAARVPWIRAHAAELDRDGDGRLTRAELSAEIDRAMRGFDRDGDGFLSDDELDEGRVRDSALAGFLRGHRDELDLDRDGRRSEAEVAALFGEFFEREDTDADGVIDGAVDGAIDGVIDGVIDGEPAARGAILLLLDDLGWRDVGFMGNDELSTPTLDRLAAAGVVFDAAYAAAPNCAPTRASLLSGAWTPRHDVYTVVDARHTPGSAHHRLLAAESAAELSPSVVTFAEALSDAGVATAFLGMWNLGKGATGPESQGFDLAVVPRDLGFANNAYHGPDGRDLPGALVDRALEFIDDRPSRDFLVELAFHSVHEPFDPDPRLVEALTEQGVPRESVDLAATLLAVDRAVERLLAALAERGLLESTTILFTSDNGGEWRRNAPLRGGKGELYEGGLRVPMFLHGPAAAPGRRVAAPVSSVDVYPTLLELFGVAAESKLDGISLVGLERDDSAGAERPLYWHFPSYTGRATPASAVRVGRWKLRRDYEAQRDELYDLLRDPGESTDLASGEPEQLARLAGLLDAWLESTGADLPRGANPDFDPDLGPRAGGAGRGRKSAR